MTSELETYSPPSGSELEQTWQLANKLARTEFVPKTMRGEHGPEAVLACMLTGRELGIGPMQSLRDVYLVNGRPSLAATLMVSRVRARGHRFRTLVNNDERATVQIHRKGETEPEPPLTFTIADAKRAKLVSKDIWQQYPERMLWARAASACCRRDCPEALGGAVYTPEELEDTQTEATWGDPITGEVYDDSDRLGGENTAPAQPVGASVPTLEQIKRIRKAEDAAQLIKTAPKDFQAHIPRAIADVHGKDPHWFWDNDSDPAHWRQALEYALELHEQRQHETSAAGGKAPPVPAADPKAAGPAPNGEAETGSAPTPTTESGRDG